MTDRSEMLGLLKEWMECWYSSDAMDPPNALHVRTAIVLAKNGIPWREETDDQTEPDDLGQPS